VVQRASASAGPDAALQRVEVERLAPYGFGYRTARDGKVTTGELLPALIEPKAPLRRKAKKICLIRGRADMPPFRDARLNAVPVFIDLFNAKALKRSLA
jgi:hypothetical protein